MIFIINNALHVSGVFRLSSGAYELYEQSMVMTVRTMARPIAERKPFLQNKGGTFCVEKEVLYLTTVYVMWVINEIPEPAC
jgi:hypothetical protein